MTKYAIMTDVNIIEGITASITFPAIIYFLKFDHHVRVYFATMFAWFITWTMRKLSVNLFLRYKQEYNIPIRTYHIDL